MTLPRILSDAKAEEALRNAAEKRLPLVATMRGENGWIVAQSRFVTCAAPRELLCIEPLMVNNPPGRPSIGPDTPEGLILGISFRRSHHKCLFSTVVAGRQRVAINADTRIDAVLIRKPDEVQQLQRRAYLRVPIPHDEPIRVVLRRPGGESETKTSGSLVDLSAGGIRACVDPDAAEPRVGDAFLVELQPAAEAPIHLHAIYRHCDLTRDGRTTWGLQLVGLEFSADGSRALAAVARLIARLRDESPCGIPALDAD